MRPLRSIALAAVATLLTGCAAVTQVGQALRGHLELLQKARPVQSWIDDPTTTPALRARLELAQRLRRFAAAELALPDNASYTRYADLGRDQVVWNVVAAPALSLVPHRWCWPLMGCVHYNGHFDLRDAEREAAALRAQGLETDVYGVPAYSTLGWTNWLGGDPLLNTFVRGDERALATLLFHELAHQVAYADGDTAFNESFATAAERLGWRRWRERNPAPVAAVEAERRDDERRAAWRALTRATRAELAAVYDGAGSDAEKLAAKAAIYERFRSGALAWAMASSPTPTRAQLPGWAAKANNASFAILGSYDDFVPAFERLFEREGKDFARWHAAVRALATQPRAERHAALDALAPRRSITP